MSNSTEITTAELRRGLSHHTSPSTSSAFSLQALVCQSAHFCEPPAVVCKNRSPGRPPIGSRKKTGTCHARFGLLLVRNSAEVRDHRARLFLKGVTS